MKSRIQTILVLTVVAVASAGLSRAQSGPGTVNFVNSTSTTVTNELTGTCVSVADKVQAALYWAPAGSTNFVQIGDTVGVGDPLPGIYAGGTRTTGPGTPGGASAQFQVRAWGGGLASHEEALRNPGVLIGESAIFQVTTGNPGASPPTPPASLLGSGLQSFTVTGTLLLPPVIKNPIMVTPLGKFGFTIVSMPGRPVEVQTSTNMTDWVPLGSLTNISGEVPFSTPATNNDGSYYRLQQLP